MRKILAFKPMRHGAWGDLVNEMDIGEELFCDRDLETRGAIYNSAKRIGAAVSIRKLEKGIVIRRVK